MFNKILLPIDLSETKLAQKALSIAIDVARKNKSELHVLTVIHGFELSSASIYIPKETMEKVTREMRNELDNYIKKSIPDEVDTHSDLVSGDPADSIIKVADKLDVDLIIIPSHSRTIGQILLGSAANKVVAHANCPVLVVKAKR